MVPVGFKNITEDGKFAIGAVLLDTTLENLKRNPKIAIAVYVENGGWGANYGVPLGALMMEQYINGKLSPASEQKAETFANKHISYGDYVR